MNRLADVFVSITDPRQPGKGRARLTELLVVAVNAVLVERTTFVEIELWAKENWIGCSHPQAGSWHSVT